MYLEYQGLSDAGRIREINEDNHWYIVQSALDSEPVGVFIVCDGMGGHLGGELASGVAIAAIKHELSDLFCAVDSSTTIVLSDSDIDAAVSGASATRRLPDSDLSDRLLTAIQRANEAILRLARMRPKEAGDAGTTLTMALVQGSKALIANIGDSRTYVVRDHQLNQITKDHSLVGGLLAQGMIKEEEVYTHPQRNIIFRSLGQAEQVSPDLFQVDLVDGDVLFLCSDGLWEMVRDKQEMVRIIEESDNLKNACQKLVDAANDAGGEDNISVILVRYHQ
jgi:protein phosphatase